MFQSASAPAASARETFSLASALDIFERVVVAALFGFFVYRLISSYLVTGAPTDLVMVASEGLVVVFVLIRRSGVVSLRPVDWVLAFVATAAPLAATPAALTPWVPGIICVLLTICGLLIQLSAKLSLRRNFGIVAANRGITTGGPYRLVRHPMYLGYFLSALGFFLANPTGWNFVAYAIAWTVQVARVLAEERLLAEDPAYRSFTERVPYRVVPGLF